MGRLFWATAMRGRRPRNPPKATQRRFAFLESRLRFERRAKRIIIALTVLVLAGMLVGTTEGRYLISRSWTAAQTAWWYVMGGKPGRDVIDASWRARREFGVKATRALVRQVYNESSPALAEVFRVAAMTPDDAVIRWGNFDGTFLLSSRVFENDDTGRSYRLRPNVHSVWLRLGALPRGLYGFFLVPDGPELSALRERAVVAIVPGTEQCTNSWGCRGPEPDVNADLRVTVLGDSMMQGLMVGDDDTPPIRLERELHTRLGKTVSVLNTGNLGYSTEQYYFSMMQYLERFRPQIIVVSLCANDFPDNGWDEALYWLDRIEQDCRTQHRICLVVPAPVDSQVAGTRTSLNFQSRLVLKAGTSSTEYCDPIEDFVDENLRLMNAAKLEGRATIHSPLYNGHLDDHHFSPLGSQLWARVVARRLILILERRQARDDVKPVTRTARP
jgi:lysophospholipase L1-like esterase